MTSDCIDIYNCHFVFGQVSRANRRSHKSWRQAGIERIEGTRRV